MLTYIRRRRPARILLGIGAALLVWLLYARSNKAGGATQSVGGREAEPEVNSHIVSGVTGHFIPIRKIYDSTVFPGANSRHFHGNLGVRPDGQSAFTLVPMIGEETMEEKRLHHKGNCFNLARSDSIPLDRDVPDGRHQKCQGKVYGHMPKTSVIFVFFNEPMSPLMRSIHSVLDRTPPELLHEVIIVDDGSDAPWLKQPLEEYLTLLPKVKLVRMEKRVGLMATRTMGAKFATGETITFLDSHIEVNVGWLEPLMARIGQDRKHVVMPIIDSIDPDSFEYRFGGLDILAFSWSLGQKGLSRARSESDPMPSPIMAGGLFSMDRAWFFELGAYDPEMRLYGGEEMEISFRIWQCGGTLECIPCSRVGHVFRTGRYWQGQVYPVPGEVIVKNKLRTAAVWMDEYKTIVQRVMPPLPAGMELGPLDHMQGIREKYQCKPFKWYLQNVYPEMFIPNDEGFVRAQGAISNPAKNACFDTLGATSQGAVIGVYPCHGSHGTQEFVLSKKGEVRVASMDYDDCLDAASGRDIRIWGCHGQGGNQEWKYDEASGHLSINGKCAQVTPESNERSPFSLKLVECDANNPSMEWRFK